MSTKSTQSQTHLTIRPEELINIAQLHEENMQVVRSIPKDGDIISKFEPITPIRSNNQNPGPLIMMKSPGLSPETRGGGTYLSNLKGNSNFLSDNNHSLILTTADTSMLDELDLSDDDLEGGRIGEGNESQGQTNDVQNRLFPDEQDLEHDLNQSERHVQLAYLDSSRIGDEKGSGVMNNSMRSLHAMSFLPDTPPHKYNREQFQSHDMPPLQSSFTPDQKLQKRANTANRIEETKQKQGSPAHPFVATPLRSIMKRHTESGEEMVGSSSSQRDRENNRRLIQEVQRKHGSVSSTVLPRELVQASPVAASSPSSSVESDDLRGELLRVNTARNTTPMKRNTPVAPSAISHSQPPWHQASHHSLLDDMSFVSGTDMDYSRHQATPDNGLSTTATQPGGLTVGGTYTVMLDARGLPTFVPLVRNYDPPVVRSGEAQRAQFANSQYSAEREREEWTRRHEPFGHMFAERNYPAWPRGRAQDDSFLSYSEGLTPNMQSYLPDTPQSTGKLRRGRADGGVYGRYSFAAPRYLHSRPLSSLAEIDERRFPHSGQMAVERADALWRAEAAAISDEYYYASSKFRPAPMPTFPPHDMWGSAADLRSTYPLFSGSSASPYRPPSFQSHSDHQHLPTANVYSRNISTTLTASSRLNSDSSSTARFVSPVRSTRPVFPGTPLGGYVIGGVSPTAMSMSRSGEKHLQLSAYFRDRLEMRDLSSSFGRAALH